jgi:hypothetical protein
MRRVVGREADLDAISRDHTDAEAPHAPGELRGDRLPAVELDLVATAAEDFLDGAGRLNQIVTGQWRSSEARAS